MNKEIERLKHCLKEMKKCLKIPKVEDCVCFSDAFKILDSEVNRLQKIEQPLEGKEELMTIKDQIEKIKKDISSQDKECLGCNPCVAAIVFKAYPNVLNSLYTDNKL